MDSIGSMLKRVFSVLNIKEKTERSQVYRGESGVGRKAPKLVLRAKSGSEPPACLDSLCREHKVLPSPWLGSCRWAGAAQSALRPRLKNLSQAMTIQPVPSGTMSIIYNIHLHNMLL